MHMPQHKINDHMTVTCNIPEVFVIINVTVSQSNEESTTLNKCLLEKNRLQ